ncbi:TMEM175 family protein [Christensenella tenuis]|uniref:DUF1211 domain-containing protein n=1 Tax=Christensenella tenuis TaxID=2763033 RepID=A0ABR7EEV4_9FIRM|nr:DUF1211 domain-containing protein [Christensenella tenuis]
MPKTRLEAFTDAVIAIIMTILVLDFAVPMEPTFAALWGMRFKFLIYILSFVSLAIYWNNHHHLLQVSKKINGRVLWHNMAFILCLTFFPFVTAWVDEHLFDTAPEITYGVVVLLADISYAALAHSLVKVNGADSEVARALCGFRKSKITFVIVGTGLGIGFFFPIAVVISIALSLVLWFTPDKRIERTLFGEDISCSASGKKTH